MASRTALRPAFTSLRAPLARPQSRFPAQVVISLRATVPVRHASSEPTDAEVNKTGLYDLHASRGAKFVPFGGYQMPVQYSDLGIGESHHWTREKASLFDVGHM